MSTPSEIEAVWKKLHREACLRGEETYIDPVIGYTVFTEVHHLKRGACCESGCRHCPYGFKRNTEKEKDKLK